MCNDKIKLAPVMDFRGKIDSGVSFHARVAPMTNHRAGGKKQRK